ncbi:MAG: DUF948 domain-containing protein [Microlunatus sp.]
MTLGGIAGLIAAIAFVALVGMLAIPLWKLGRVLEELRSQVHDLGEESVPILTELQDTVRTANSEIGRISEVTEEVATLSKNAASVSENAAQVSSLVTHAVGTPIIKVRSLAYGIKAGFSDSRNGGRELEQRKG